MATVETSAQSEQIDAIKSMWLKRLSDLVSLIETWAKESDWSTRWIEKKLEDSEIGDYLAPALLLQKETARLILDPIGRLTVGGSDGVVDLYLMPGYDDIAKLFYLEDQWHLSFVFPGTSRNPKVLDAEPRPLTHELLDLVLEAMVKNAK